MLWEKSRERLQFTSVRFSSASLLNAFFSDHSSRGFRFCVPLSVLGFLPIWCPPPQSSSRYNCIPHLHARDWGGEALLAAPVLARGKVLPISPLPGHISTLLRDLALPVGRHAHPCPANVFLLLQPTHIRGTSIHCARAGAPDPQTQCQAL